MTKVFLKIISGEPGPRAWEEVREAREVALSLVSLSLATWTVSLLWENDRVTGSVEAKLSFHFASAQNITYVYEKYAHFFQYFNCNAHVMFSGPHCIGIVFCLY